MSFQADGRKLRTRYFVAPRETRVLLLKVIQTSISREVAATVALKWQKFSSRSLSTNFYNNFIASAYSMFHRQPIFQQWISKALYRYSICTTCIQASVNISLYILCGIVNLLQNIQRIKKFRKRIDVVCA